MIKPEDCEFHFKPDSHWQWVETIALPFHVPEANINAALYVVARPMLGVCMADVSLHDRITDLWEEQLNTMGPHISGYVLEDGERYGITASRGTQQIGLSRAYLTRNRDALRARC